MTPAEIIATLREQAAQRNATWPGVLLKNLMPLCDEFERLQARDDALMTKHGAFKGTGNPELDALMQAPSPAFGQVRDSLPENYWARYDLSAVRLGWELAQRALDKPKTAPGATTPTRDAAMAALMQAVTDVGTHQIVAAVALCEGHATRPDLVAVKLLSNTTDYDLIVRLLAGASRTLATANRGRPNNARAH
ncbi:hypothetical protein JN531_012575 [Flagellatimonas centrodinii]|uniref:hypothetical protein n=1 Tax=Flagellatimonas centrodinii TaxID=2806210 RepID=UPI001FF07B1B|nr:hypothetical protein [Flagellatimonas centrodinii]ULQ45934.1 hypothetical protein JN531_012575 [Flagellatimonas centrodinii]